jgi:hypothetical protein
MKQSSSPLPATGVRPADYALGSPESRAAARMMLENSSHLSQPEEDALTIYRGGFELRLDGDPSYEKGKEISERVNGPIIPVHQDPRAQRSTSASLAFEFAFKREPKHGDVLCPEILDLLYSPAFEEMRFNQFGDAWGRQNPGVECPMKFEDGKRYVLRYGKWDCASTDPEREWASLRWEELGRPTLNIWDPLVPRIPGLFFLGVVDGKHKARAATQEETDNYILPTTGAVGRVIEMETRRRLAEGQ